MFIKSFIISIIIERQVQKYVKTIKQISRGRKKSYFSIIKYCINIKVALRNKHFKVRCGKNKHFKGLTEITLKSMVSSQTLTKKLRRNGRKQRKESLGGI